MEYDVQFICCFCKITDTERKCIMRKHRQNYMSDSMEPLAKKRFLENKKRYSIMGATNKKELLSRCSEKLEKARLVELCITQFNRKINKRRPLFYMLCLLLNTL